MQLTLSASVRTSLLWLFCSFDGWGTACNSSGRLLAPSTQADSHGPEALADDASCIFGIVCFVCLQALRERTSANNGETITSLPISIPLSTVQPNKLPVSIPLASVVLPSRVEKVVSRGTLFSPIILAVKPMVPYYNEFIALFKCGAR